MPSELRPVPRLSEALFLGRSREWSDLVPIAANVVALQTVAEFMAGEPRLLAIHGPSGWGKSVLLGSAHDRLAERYPTAKVLLKPASALGQCLREAERADILLLDDAQEVFARPRLRQSVRHLLDRRARGGRATLTSFTLTGPSRGLADVLPRPHLWTTCCMGEPDVPSRALILHQIASTEGLTLPIPVIRFLARRLVGTGRTFVGAVHRLRLLPGNWSDPAIVSQALGLLTPFLDNQGGWDLRDQAHEALSAWYANSTSSDVRSLSEQDWGAYLLHILFRLNEEEVATYYRMSPGRVFAACRLATVSSPEFLRNELCAHVCRELVGN